MKLNRNLYILIDEDRNIMGDGECSCIDNSPFSDEFIEKIRMKNGVKKVYQVRAVAQETPTTTFSHPHSDYTTIVARKIDDEF